MFINRQDVINKVTSSINNLYRVSLDNLKKKTSFINNINQLSIESKNISNKLEYISLKFQKLAAQNGGDYQGKIEDVATEKKIFSFFFCHKYLDFSGNGIKTADNEIYPYWYHFTSKGIEGMAIFLNLPIEFKYNDIMFLSNGFSTNDKELEAYLKDFTSRITMDHNLLNQLLDNLKQIFNNQLTFEKKILSNNI